MIEAQYIPLFLPSKGETRNSTTEIDPQSGARDQLSTSIERSHRFVHPGSKNRTPWEDNRVRAAQGHRIITLAGLIPTVWRANRPSPHAPTPPFSHSVAARRRNRGKRAIPISATRQHAIASAQQA